MSSRGIRDLLASGLATVPNRFYSGPVKRTVRALGLETLIKRVYGAVFAGLVDNTVELSVSGFSATFSVQSPTEYRRLTGRLLEVNRPVLESLLEETEPTDVVWDVGAHIGRYSCFLGQTLDPGNLVAIEAHPANVESLKRNLSLNGIEARIVPKALTDREGKATFTLRNDEAGEFIRGAEYSQGWSGDYERTVEIETCTGETLVSEYGCPRPTVIRIDIAGGEPQAIEGMTGLLTDDRCRLVYVTLYPNRYDEPDIVGSRLREFGFETTLIDDRWLKAERK